MRVKFLVFNILILAVISAFSQSHADCETALDIESDSIQIPSVNGPGKILEIKGYELGNPKYFTEEHNTVWLKYIVGASGEFSFDLIPNQATDDWDFMLFKMDGHACNDIADGKLKPDRSNLARNNPALKGKTGLSNEADEAFQPAGVHPNYSNMLKVDQGDVLMIAIDINENHDKGFALHIHIKAKELPQKEVVEEDSDFGFVDMTEEEESTGNFITIKFQVLSGKTREPLSCSGEVKGVFWEADEIALDEGSQFEFQVPKDKWFYFNVNKEGYTFSSEKYKATDDLNNSVQEIYIEQVKTGEHIVLKEIVFRENTTQLLPTSINALEKLIGFMNEYPNARIEIQGHVNAPGYDNTGKVKRMSLKRAEQIKQFLVDAEIDGSRIEVSGMGNEEMIYPSPSNYEEEKANRRVEIEILSL